MTSNSHMIIQVNINVINCVGDICRSFTNVFSHQAVVSDVRSWAFRLIQELKVFTRCRCESDVRLETTKSNGEPWPMYADEVMLIAFLHDDSNTTITVTAYA